MSTSRRPQRRRLAALTALGILGSVALLPGSASAATNQLTVVTLTRGGAQIRVPVTALDLSNNQTYALTSGKAASLPKGTYAALTDIYNPQDGTDTLGATIVRVSGATRTTIDARAGQPIRVSLSPGVSNDYQILQAGICANGFGSSATGGWNVAGKMFVIPNSSRALQFGTMAIWRVPNGSGSDTGYAVMSKTVGLPRGYARTVGRSGLAALAFEVRRGPGISPTNTVAVQPAGDMCFSPLYAGFATADAPFRVQTYLSPGAWTVRADTFGGNQSVGSYFQDVTVVAGKGYLQRYASSAWGPGSNLPYTVRKILSFDAHAMFSDPLRGAGEAGSRYVMTLSRAGKVLKRRSGTGMGNDDGTLQYTLPSAGWYVLSVDSTRYYPGLASPADLLSTRATASFRFPADPRRDEVAPVYLVRFLPQGLSMTNAAAPRSTTTVALSLDHPAQTPDARLTAVRLKSLTVQASDDGGRTWHTVRVTQSNGHWSAAVPNPASGTVSLRATAVTTAGASSLITVYKAYGIG